VFFFKIRYPLAILAEKLFAVLGNLIDFFAVLGKLTFWILNLCEGAREEKLE
jgi:hypothetical protein